MQNQIGYGAVARRINGHFEGREGFSPLMPLIAGSIFALRAEGAIPPALGQEIGEWVCAHREDLGLAITERMVSFNWIDGASILKFARL